MTPINSYLAGSQTLLEQCAVDRHCCSEGRLKDPDRVKGLGEASAFQARELLLVMDASPLQRGLFKTETPNSDQEEYRPHEQ